MEQYFAGVGKIQQESFLPRIFFGKSKTLPPVVGAISTFPLKKYGLGLQNPVTSSADKYTSFLCAIYKLIDIVMVERWFSTSDCLQEVKEERQDGKKDWYDENDAKLRGVVNNQGAFKK